MLTLGREKNPLPRWGLEPTSVLCLVFQSDAVATPPPLYVVLVVAAAVVVEVVVVVIRLVLVVW